MKKKDYILIVVILCVAAGSYLSHKLLNNMASSDVIVKVNGEISGSYSLSDDQEIAINQGSNRLVINNGKAKMAQADCPDQLCVHQRAIAANNENIICLPNKVIVEIKSRAESQIDAVTN